LLTSVLRVMVKETKSSLHWKLQLFDFYEIEFNTFHHFSTNYFYLCSSLPAVCWGCGIFLKWRFGPLLVVITFWWYTVGSLNPMRSFTCSMCMLLVIIKRSRCCGIRYRLGYNCWMVKRCVCGDFNVVRCMEERHSARDGYTSIDFAPFNQFIDDNVFNWSSAVWL